jgi:hypothetical protein
LDFDSWRFKKEDIKPKEIKAIKINNLSYKYYYILPISFRVARFRIEFVTVYQKEMCEFLDSFVRVGV